MPLPLPHLDTRRWADLVAEAHALIPRFAPGWTDHNVHDPGIMLVELLAWLTEQDIYRANRVPARHRRTFLRMLGYLPRPPEPARTYLSLRVEPLASTVDLPAGTVFGGQVGDGALRFRTVDPVVVSPLGLLTVQSFDGARFADLTGSARDRVPVLPWGSDPAAAGSPEHDPALYLGFDRPVPAGTPVRLWLDRDAPPGAGDRPAGPDRDRHHGLRTRWEFWDGAGWSTLDPGQGAVADGTRGLALPGPVVLALPAATAPSTLGAAAVAAHYVRCRLAHGRPDRAPVLADIAVNAVAAEQSGPVRATLPVAAGVTIPAPGPEPRRLLLTVDPDGTVTGLVDDDAADVPPVLVLAAAPGSVTLTLTLLGHGDATPRQRVRLPGAPVAGGSVRLWTTAGGAARGWRQRDDLGASTRTDADFVLDASTGDVVFGDGEHGEVVPAGAAIFASYDVTAAAAGNLPAGCTWTLAGADDEVNRVLLGAEPATVEVTAANRRAATGGADEEDVDRAAGRAAETLWAHERIVDLGPPDATLDQLDRAEVLARTAPERATTRLDFERLALQVPGTAVARARAWSGLDARHPGLAAPGTVSVVVVPYLPVGAPRPTPGLLRLARRYLDERRVVCTRLVVTGPEYLRVAVGARVAVGTGADPARVRHEVTAALDRFLDPLAGGPAGRGWPFGRDVYRTEVLRAIATVRGVEHVRGLTLRGDGHDAGCGNLCVPTMWLVAPGDHEIEME